MLIFYIQCSASYRSNFLSLIPFISIFLITHELVLVNFYFDDTQIEIKLFINIISHIFHLTSFIYQYWGIFSILEAHPHWYDRLLINKTGTVRIPLMMQISHIFMLVRRKNYLLVLSDWVLFILKYFLSIFYLLLPISDVSLLADNKIQ